jgi:acetyl esterase/lipase
MGDDNNEEIPEPHSLLFHPYLTITEKIVSKVVDLVSGFKGLSKTEIRSKTSEDALSKIRKSMREAERVMGKSALVKWAKVSSLHSSSPGTLAESSGCIPFRKNILREWNIVDEHTVLPDAIAAANNREWVKVLVRFPSSLLPAELRENATVLEYSGCLEVGFGKVDWKKFAPDVPILLQFHGGAMVLGGPHDSLLIEETARLVENASTASPPDVITICVDYGLGPDSPFPLGIMDALSVIDYLLNDNNSRESIHVTGMSAGANLSLVAGLEGFRRFPGRISSIQAQSPFVNPAGDSMSYYMNQAVLFPDVNLLRWAWQAYLGLEKPKETPNDNDHNDESELEKVLRKDSNYSSWKTWKADYPSEALHRLVNPALGIPEGLNGDKAKNAPTIIVRYNMGDPLHDDGKMVLEALKQKAGGNASFYEEMNLHCDVMGPYDARAPQEYWKVWSEAIFGNDKSDSK